MLFKRIPKNVGIPFEMRRFLPLYPPSPTPTITTLQSQINNVIPHISILIPPSPPLTRSSFPSLSSRLLLSAPYSSIWGSLQKAHVFWLYDEMPLPLNVAIDVMQRELKANKMNDPELKI